MIRKLREFLIGILRRVAVVLVLVPSLLVGVLYVAALSFVFLWNGHLSTGAPSKTKARLDRAYNAGLRGIARVVRVS